MKNSKVLWFLTLFILLAAVLGYAFFLIFYFNDSIKDHYLKKEREIALFHFESTKRTVGSVDKNIKSILKSSLIKDLRDYHYYDFFDDYNDSLKRLKDNMREVKKNFKQIESIHIKQVACLYEFELEEYSLKKCIDLIDNVSILLSIDLGFNIDKSKITFKKNNALKRNALVFELLPNIYFLYEKDMFSQSLVSNNFVVNMLVSVFLFVVIVLFILFFLWQDLISFFKYLVYSFSKKDIQKIQKIEIKNLEFEFIKNIKKEFNSLVDNILSTSELEEKRNRMKFEFDLSCQIAHDIRSPLEALKSVTAHINDLDYTNRQIIKNSIDRITGIANGLLKSSREISTEYTALNLRILADNIVSDKNFEYRVRVRYNSSLDYKNAFINGSENDLYRALSNIINNGYESQDPNKVCIEINLIQFEEKILLTIEDFGEGMSSELIKQALSGGTTTKEGGSGLGLSFSKKVIEAHGGSLSVISSEGVGTKVTILLPVIDKPDWFTDVIEIYSDASEVMCVDDDPSFLELYKDKLKNISVPLYTKTEEKIEETNFLPDSQFFFDYDLGNNQTGLDFIINNNLSSRSTLVTSMYQNVEIQSLCVEHGICILPKQIFNNSKVVTVNSTIVSGIPVIPDKIVFIDNDELMHMSWSMEAKKENVNLSCFYTVEEFLRVSDQFIKNTKIYIDSNLSNEVKGEIESEKIYKAGFKNIYLATGYSPEDFEKPEWIKEIVGKRAKFK